MYFIDSARMHVSHGLAPQLIYFIGSARTNVSYRFVFQLLYFIDSARFHVFRSHRLVPQLMYFIDSARIHVFGRFQIQQSSRPRGEHSCKHLQDNMRKMATQNQCRPVFRQNHGEPEWVNSGYLNHLHVLCQITLLLFNISKRQNMIPFNIFNFKCL